MHEPTNVHWLTAKYILRYLKRTVYHGASLHNAMDFTLTSFSNFDRATYPDDRNSTNAYEIFFRDNLVSSFSNKQKVVIYSSIEVEYHELANSYAKLLWFQSILTELNISLLVAPILFCDKISAKHLATNLIQHVKMKHVELDLHFVHDRMTAGALDVQFISYVYELADALTKPLLKPRFCSLCPKLLVLPST